MARRKKLKKGPRKVLKVLLIVLFITLGCRVIEYLVLSKVSRTPIENHPDDVYYGHDFGYIRIKSTNDYNSNGIDDYTDYLNGAKKLAEINPKYDSKGYYAGGYPPEGVGVCTDVIWYTLKEAGYYLKDMMAKDIRERNDSVYHIATIDDNIDFRRVGNQEKFFKKYAETLTTDLSKIGEFQPGDIVTFDDSDHIAIISDKKNVRGIPYLIQNSDEEQTEKEEDVLEETPMKITGHYRFTYTEEIQKLIDRM